MNDEVTTSAAIDERRMPLTRERVLRAGVALADRDGIEGLSMRKLGQELGVDPMALYRHIRSKNDLIDGLVELIVDSIPRPETAGTWKATLRRHAMEARQIMVRHPWARRALEERGTTGPATLGYLESVLATLRDGGFSVDLAHHALHVLGSRIFGFSQDLFEEGSADTSAGSAAAARALAGFPRIVELATSVSHDGVLGPCDDDVEFAFGLDLILDGLERLRVGAGVSPA